MAGWWKEVGNRNCKCLSYCWSLNLPTTALTVEVQFEAAFSQNDCRLRWDSCNRNSNFIACRSTIGVSSERSWVYTVSQGLIHSNLHRFYWRSTSVLLASSHGVSLSVKCSRKGEMVHKVGASQITGWFTVQPVVENPGSWPRESMMLWLQVADISFLYRVSGCSRPRTSDVWSSNCCPFTLMDAIWSGLGISMPSERLPLSRSLALSVPQACRSGTKLEPESTGATYYTLYDGSTLRGPNDFFPYWKTIGLSFPHACFYYFSPHIQYFDPFVEWNQNLNKNLKFYYLLKFNLTFNIITFSFAQIVSPLVVTVCQQHDECFGKVLFSSSTELLEVILFDMFIKKSFISGSKNTKGLNSPGEHIEPNHSQYSYLQFKPQIDEDDK